MRSPRSPAISPRRFTACGSSPKATHQPVRGRSSRMRAMSPSTSPWREGPADIGRRSPFRWHAGGRCGYLRGWPGNHYSLRWPAPAPGFAADHRYKTGPDGRYAIAPRDKPFGIVVVHEKGFGDLTAEDIGPFHRCDAQAVGSNRRNVPNQGQAGHSRANRREP